jgi:LacI family transcriptional regulator
MATIRDVADLAGVSTATVSHVLNNSRPVMPHTRQLVLAAIARLNYRPSAIARSLTTSVTRTVGVLVADITNPFFAALLRGIEDRMSARGYNLVVCNTDEQSEKETRYLELLLTRRVDGVIVAPTGMPQPLFRELVQQKVPLVFIDRFPPERLGTTITADNAGAAYSATEYLVQLGHRRIGILARNPSLSTVIGRLGGYRQALSDHRIPTDESLIAITEQNVDAAFAGARRLLKLPDRPSAIIATNLNMMLGLLHALQAENLTCPADLSIICFDDHPWAPFFTPPLTVIRQPVSEMCDVAVETLLGAVEHSRGKKEAHHPTTPSDIVIKAELIKRASCRPLQP